MKKLITVSILAGLFTTTANAENQEGYFIKPYVGYSQMSDVDADSTGIGTANGQSSIELDSGFVAGLGFGYRYNSDVAVELAWEYRSNDSETTLPDGDKFNDGNYASNLFFLNGYYFPIKSDDWEAYLGGGLSWAQEIDIDLERAGTEESFSGDGDVGYQLFVGGNYLISKDYSINGELRYGSITGIDLEGEGNSGKIEDIDYETVTLQLGLNYYF